MYIIQDYNNRKQNCINRCKQNHHRMQIFQFFFKCLYNEEEKQLRLFSLFIIFIRLNLSPGFGLTSTSKTSCIQLLTLFFHTMVSKHITLPRREIRLLYPLLELHWDQCFYTYSIGGARCCCTISSVKHVTKICEYVITLLNCGLGASSPHSLMY